jgi:hypothetical protein
MATYNGHIITANAITIGTDEGPVTVPSSHMAFGSVKAAIQRADYSEALRLADATKVINDFGEGEVYVLGGVVYYGDTELNNGLTQRIGRMVAEGYDVSSMVVFLSNLMDNPSGRAIKELYSFLEQNSLPITEDGYFLAYKSVGSNYMDRYSGTIRNAVGDVVEMPRNAVMDDPNQTCSVGLHFCSMEYLEGFWGLGDHVMIMKINPKDVVSIPVDYNNSKGRCCKYEVIGEHKDGLKDTLSEHTVYEYSEEDMNGAWQEGFDDGVSARW